MVFLHKKPAGKDDSGNNFFDADNTRPLNITNADNRIIANAIRLTIEPILQSWISPAQQGFIKGRIMINNID